MNAQHSIPNERARMIRALAEAKRMRKIDLKTTNLAGLDKDRLGLETTHVLVDYRNGNKHICRKAMTRKLAWELNQRLEGTGLGWGMAQH